MTSLMMKSISAHRIGWFLLALCASSQALGQFVFEQKSEPAGIFTSGSQTYDSNTKVSSRAIELISGNFAFSHWSLDGIRMQDQTGSALSNFTFLINRNSVAVAHYLDKYEDSDGDGIPDWYETRYLGSLEANHSSDSDQDGISVLDEFRIGLSPVVADQPEKGGISRRRSQTVFVNLGGARKLTIASDPPGLLATEIIYPEVNSTYTSVSLSGPSSGYQFAYWEINGQRAADSVGIGLSKVVELMDEDKQVVAKYFGNDLDEDSDGIPDWYEWHTFGTLDNDQSSDSDHDSILLSEERKFGLNAALADSFKPGGISRRRSATVQVNLGGATRVQLYSNPTGLIASQTLFLENNSTYSTVALSGLSHGYYFSHWEINGERVADSTGIGLGTAQAVLDQSKEIVAKYYDQDEDLDSDGIPDWYEWQQFGSLDLGPESDPDEDGLPVAFEMEFGLSSVIADKIASGGVSRRRSNTTGFVFDPDGVQDSDGDGLSDDLEKTIGTNPELSDTDGDGYGDAEERLAGTDPTSADSMPNQPPANLSVSSGLSIFENLPVGTVITQFQANDPDGDQLIFSLVGGAGDLDNGLFSMDANGTLSSSVVFDYELNASSYSIRVSASDVNQGAVEANFTVLLLDMDDSAPLIELIGDTNITHEAGYPYYDLNASWTDEVDGDGIVIAEGEVNASVPGTYLLRYDYTDLAGNAAETVFREVNVINLPPHDLYISNDANLSVWENEPDGTWIASFLGKDQNPDSILTYSLLESADSKGSFEHNFSDGNSTAVPIQEIFLLDENGSLFTRRSLDYEVDPHELPITIRVTDQHGGSFDQSFFVSLINVVEDFDGDGEEDHYDPDDDGDGFEDTVEISYGFDPFERWNYPEPPIVRTLKVLEQNQSLIFGAKILSSGGFENLDVGVSIFDESGALIHEFISSWNEAGGDSHSFPMEGLSKGKKIRYQAYAENFAGRTVGQFLDYWLGGSKEMENWWESDAELDGGWRESSWFGTYLPNLKNQWVYHFQLGWVFAQPDGQAGFWLWMPEEEWLWTKAGVWPFLWSNTSSDWLYPLYSSGKRYFYDYSKESLR